MSDVITQSDRQTLAESALFAAEHALRNPSEPGATEKALDKIRVALAAAGWVSVHDIDLKAELAKVGLALELPKTQ